MRTAAHIGIFKMMIQGRMVVSVNILFEDLQFVVFFSFFENLVSAVPVHNFLDNGIVLFCQLVHSFFKFGNILFSQGVVQINVIIKAFFNNRTDGHFAIRPQLLDCVPQQMRAGVTNNLHAFIILCCDNRYCSILFNQITGITKLTVNTSCDTGLGQSGTDAFSNVHNSNRFIKFFFATIW